MMKQEMILVFLCVGAAQAQITLSLDTLSEVLIKIKTLEETVNELKSKNEERVKVAFSTSVSSSSDIKNIGPYSEDRTLVYEHAFINIGNAYDTTTGIFTAPVKGVYFFIFVIFNHHEKATALRLLKNGNFMIAASDNPPAQDTEDTTVNSVSLLLEQGDKVSLLLPAGRQIYTDSGKRNTFSGHLLFTV